MNDPDPYARPDLRQFAPATMRNRDAILRVLGTFLPETGLVLEIGSGTGEHITYFAGHHATLVWQPSDADPERRDSIAAWTAALGLGNVLPPLPLDVLSEWPLDRADAVLCINMIHVAPWDATFGLMEGAARVLPAGGPLYLYGPFKRGGRHTAPGNAEFDAGLRAQNPEWGVRDLGDVTAAAARFGLAHGETVAMPANNLSVIFRRS